MKPKQNPRRLLVEGKRERLFLSELIERNGYRWEDADYGYAVYIKELDGVESLLRPRAIRTEARDSAVSTLGIIVDADADPSARWRALRRRCLEHEEYADQIPEMPPPGGLILDDVRPRLGIWLMPDNVIDGDLERFSSLLVRDVHEPLWDFAKQAVHQAKILHGAPYGDGEAHKANIYTYLAWQNDPRKQLHEALRDEVLDPRSPQSATFVDWFVRLHDLGP